MSLVIMSAALLDLQANRRVQFNSENQLCYLYTNNRTPAWTDGILDYTPATYDGASGQATAWPTAPALDGNGGAILQAAPCNFQPTGTTHPNSVYGYYILDTVNVRLVFAERFGSGPYMIGNNLTPLVVVPIWRLLSIP